MKGIIFNLFERVVTDEFGEDAWEDILDAAGVDGSYTAVGTYDPNELHKLIAAASSRLDRPSVDLVRWFGRSAMPHLVERYPSFFEPHDSALEFIRTLNDIIHPEVRKLFPGAYAPEFEFEPRDDGSLALRYHSYRGLCAFAEGLVEGAADHYHQSVAISQSECTARGDETCVLECAFSSEL